MLRATGKPYHPACFNCVVCGKNLDGTTFTVDATNQIHCIDDFHRSVKNISVLASVLSNKPHYVVAIDDAKVYF